MHLINTTTYPTNYKPHVVYGTITISYYPESMREKAKTKPHLVKPHVKTYLSLPTSFTLDCNNKFPTKKLYDAALNRIVKELLNKKQNKIFAWIKEVDVLHSAGTVNYQFNQLVH